MKTKLFRLIAACILSLSLFSVSAFAQGDAASKCDNTDPLIRLTILPQVSDKFFESVKKHSNLDSISKVKACNRLNRKFSKRECKSVSDPSAKPREISGTETCDSGEDLIEEFKYDKLKEIKIEQAVQKRTCYTAPETGSYQLTTSDILGCATITGDVRLWMIPYYVRYISDFIIAISGSIAVLVIIFGGYTYIVGSVTSEGEGASKGKATIGYGVLGLVVILSAWTVVNVILALLTS